MTEIKKNKVASPLVETVLSLDELFSALDRLSAQIEEIDLTSDFSMDRAQQLMKRFAEYGENVSSEVLGLAKILAQAQIQAETAARIVANKAVQLQQRKDEYQLKMQKFGQLGEKVQAISLQLVDLKSPADKTLSEEERAVLTKRLSTIDSQLQPLIEEANFLKEEAQNSKMKNIERDADSLKQSLQAVSHKLVEFNQARI